MLAGPLWLQATLFLGGVLDDCLWFVIALLRALLEATACGGTQFPGLLGAAGDGSVLLHVLLGDGAHLLGPLGALGVGGVSCGLVLTLLLHLSSALNHVILDIMDLLLGPALRLVLSPANLRALDVTVLDKRSPADLDGLVEGNLLILNETALPVVLLALLLLLRLVVGDIGGVAPLVIGVVTLDHVVILSLLYHLDLVDTLLAVVARPGSSHISEAHAGIIISLPCWPGLYCLVGLMMVPMGMVSSSLVEGEGVLQVPGVPAGGSVGVSPQLPGTKSCLTKQKEGETENFHTNCHHCL